MKREEMINNIKTHGGQTWDFIIIGGGATGIGAAIETASRGYTSLLLEKNDFAQGTSSRSTKLIHGGVRYLQQGNISLVYEALKERGYLIQNAPHLVHKISFAVPRYDWWEGPFYGIGLKLYDAMSGKRSFGRSKIISRKRILEMLPTIETKGLRGGVIYYDGQFDDARLAINMAETACEQGATILNYFGVTGLIREKGKITGVIARDMEEGIEYELSARVVINATGVFSDEIRQMEEKSAHKMINPSQGVHIVLDKDFLPGKSAIMIPNTDDGRVLFAIPWKKHVVVGTTDTPVDRVVLEPRAFSEEVEFLLSHISRYLVKKPSKDDILSVFAGIRPLVYSGGEGKNTAAASRDFKIDISPGGLVTVAGGKWTTYRKMAEDTIDQAINLAGLAFNSSVSKGLHIHGYRLNTEEYGSLKDYGSDAPLLKKVIDSDPIYKEAVSEQSDLLKGEVIWAVRNEMARTVDDLLARRKRLLFLDAKASLASAPVVAELMASELKRGKNWIDLQLSQFKILAGNYIPS